MRYLDALARRPLDRPPVWLMRQAGRYLPEYRERRSTIGFQEAISRPEVAAELTLQPMKRFGLDAAIIFADIMTPLESMGVDVTFDPGPKLSAPITNAAALRPLDVAGPVATTLEALRIVRRELPDDHALIGFSGAPFTLAAYLARGKGDDEFLTVRALAHEAPDRLARLLDSLAEAMGTYLLAQLDAGADGVQLFDSWAGLLAAEQFAVLNVPVLERICARLEGRGPITYFAPNAWHLLGHIGRLPVDAVGVDWRGSLLRAWEKIGDRAIQGNLDPAVLLAGPDATRKATETLLMQVGGRPGHIVNVGHGLRPDTPVESVAALVDCVTGWWSGSSATGSD